MICVVFKSYSGCFGHVVACVTLKTNTVLYNPNNLQIASGVCNTAFRHTFN